MTGLPLVPVSRNVHDYRTSLRLTRLTSTHNFLLFFVYFRKSLINTPKANLWHLGFGSGVRTKPTWRTRDLLLNYNTQEERRMTQC